MAVYLVARRLRTWVEEAVAPEEATRRVPVAQVLVLRDVLEHPQTTVQEVADRLGLAQSRVSTVVAEARARDRLVGVPDPRDRRKVRLAASDRLAAWLDAGLTRPAAEGLAPLLDGLSADDRATVLRGLALLQQQLDRTAQRRTV